MYADEKYIISIRRELHKHPEVGFDLPLTLALVRRELEKMGYDLSATTLKTLPKKRNIVQKCKYVIGNRVPIKFRYYIKKFLSKFGMKFSTKY